MRAAACPYGIKCQFAHGVEELRVRQVRSSATLLWRRFCRSDADALECAWRARGVCLASARRTSLRAIRPRRAGRSRALGAVRTGKGAASCMAIWLMRTSQKMTTAIPTKVTSTVNQWLGSRRCRHMPHPRGREAAASTRAPTRVRCRRRSCKCNCSSCSNCSSCNSPTNHVGQIMYRSSCRRDHMTRKLPWVPRLCAGVAAATRAAAPRVRRQRGSSTTARANRTSGTCRHTRRRMRRRAPPPQPRPRTPSEHNFRPMHLPRQCCCPTRSCRGAMAARVRRRAH